MTTSTTAIPPAGMEIAQLICGGCRTLLMHASCGTHIRCSSCHMGNLVPAVTPPRVNCGNCHTVLMFPDGAPSVRCAVKCPTCHSITNVNVTPPVGEILEPTSTRSSFRAQMRDLVETRQQLLTLKLNHRMHWIMFAIAHHMNFNGLKAVDILEAYELTLEDDYTPDNEHSEMLLYKISLMEECGLTERALEELRKKESKIIDKLSYKEQEVSLLQKLGRFDEGEKLYRILLSMNPDNYRYYEGLQKCMRLYSANGQYSSDEIGLLEALYESLGRQYIRSSAVKRIPLDFLSAEKFHVAAENYVRPFLSKGTPSLFSDLSLLYDHPEKANILKQLFLELELSIKKTGGFPGRVEKEPPSTLIWILFYLAQHYDKRGQYDVALSKIDEAIKHTPTVIDLYSMKSRILKHAGDLAAAATFANEARCMDLADRYASIECVKRMLQADQVVLAEKAAVLFMKLADQVVLAEKASVLIMKDGVKKHNTIGDKQSMWYELASGESYLRQGDLGRALKKFYIVEKYYSDITEEKFHFHSCCLRKMTLRTYFEMLKFEDRLHSYSYLRKATAGTIKCYLKLYDSPSKSSGEEDEEISKEAEEARAKKETDVKEESSASKSKNCNIKQVDMDPNGEKLLQVENPLVEATKYLKLLQKQSSDSLETHLLSFEVNMRKQKILLALQAVNHLLRLDPDNPDTHCCLIKLFHKVGSMPAPATDTEILISRVIEAERSTFIQLQGRSLIEANAIFLENHKKSLRHRAAVAEMTFVMEPNKKREAINLIEESQNSLFSSNGTRGSVKNWSLKDCIAVHKLLVTVLDEHDAASRWKIRCAEYFPYSTYFEGSCSSAVRNSAYYQTKQQVPENGSKNNKSVPSNGNVEKLEALKDLVLQ